jgi:hypothetical protein
MPSPFDDVCCARIPRAALPLLASLRVEPGLRASLTEDHAWLRWDAGNEHVLRIVMPIHDAQLFRFHEGRWHRFGESLPAFDFPGDLDYEPLSHALFPAPVQPMSVPALAGQPMRLALERDDRPRPTTALLCPLASLLAWCDTVPSARLAMLQGTCLDERILVLGANLPLLEDGQRFWGHDVLVPLGYGPVPALPESALKEAAGLEEQELLLWKPNQMEVIARTLLAPLTRAGLRLSDREACG